MDKGNGEEEAPVDAPTRPLSSKAWISAEEKAQTAQSIKSKSLSVSFQDQQGKDSDEETVQLEDESKDDVFFDAATGPDVDEDEDSQDELLQEASVNEGKGADGDDEGGEEEDDDDDDDSQTDAELAEQQVEDMWAGKSNVLVAVRVRPMNSKEKQATRNVVKVVDQRLVVVLNNQDSGKKRQRQDVLGKNRSKEKKYAFDYAFGPEIPTNTVYNHTTKFLIDGVVIGYNATVFAYGATGAGKTYTMLGGAAGSSESTDSNSTSPGIMVLTLRDLFEKINDNMRRCASRARKKQRDSIQHESGDINQGGSLPRSSNQESSEQDDDEMSKATPGSTTSIRTQITDRSYKVSCSFLEVYNEMIRDLLTPSSEYLDLREDPVKGPTVTGLSEVEATSAEDVMFLLRKGNARRTTEGTAANQASSRSHAVLQITVERKDNLVNSNAVAVSNVTIGKLSLIDLAGSERASVTQNRGMRLVEGANINRSLLALGNCINALREGGKGAFVPYRDSKLTRLLKDSLGGNCRTVMVAAVSPAKNQCEETLNTLKYANRAKNIKTQAERNVLNVDYHVTEYVNLIGKLKTEISSLRNQLKKPPTSLQQLQQQQIVQQQIKQHEQSLQHQLGQTKPPAGGKQPVQTAGGRMQPQPPPSGSTNEGSRASVEKKQMDLLREQVVLHFKERMQLCRSLIEIEAQNIANNAELGVHRVVIQRWEESMEQKVSLLQQKRDEDEDPFSSLNEESDDDDEGNGSERNKDEIDDDESDDDDIEEKKEKMPPSSSSFKKKHKRKLSVVTEPPNVRSARIESQQLQRANLKNGQLKLDIERRLAENEKASSALRNQMQTRITTEERRELMELEYRIGMLELENMELERSRMLHRCSMQYKDQLIKRLLGQLEIRDCIIEEQKKLLGEHGVGTSTVEGALEEHINEMESLHMLQSLPIGAPATPGTPTPRQLMLGGSRMMLRPISGNARQGQKLHAQRRVHEIGSAGILHGTVPVREKPAVATVPSGIPAFGSKKNQSGKGQSSKSQGKAQTGKKADVIPRVKASVKGLPSIDTDGQMFPLHRLEEELMRIEMSHPYTPSSVTTKRGKQNSDSSSRIVGPGRPSKVSGSGVNGSTNNNYSSSNPVDREKRRKRYHPHMILPTGHLLKKSHPYLRQNSLVARKSDKIAKQKQKNRSSNQSNDDLSVTKGGDRATIQPSNKKGRGIPRDSSNRSRSKKGTNWLVRMNKTTQKKQVRGPLSPTKGSTVNTEGNTHPSHRASRKHRSATFDTSSEVTKPTPPHSSAPRELLGTTNPVLSLPPINPSNTLELSDTDGVSNNDADEGDDMFAERTAAVAPVPPVGLSEETSHCSSHNSDLSANEEPVSKNSGGGEKKNALSRLNLKIANGDSITDGGESKSYTEEKAGGDQGSESGTTSKEMRRAERKERKKLERRWAELSFVLRRDIKTEYDLSEIRGTAQRSLNFLDQLDRKASELNVLRGTLSRLLLPYSEDTAAAEQRANTPVTGDSPLDSVMDLNTRRQMVTSANDLRSLVRVKIADDADLDQARTAVHEVRRFFDKLEVYAEKKNCTPFEALNSLG